MNPIARNAKDFWTGLIYIFVGSAALIISRDYDMGTAVKMGPAYFPTILSVLLMVIGIISVLRSFLKSGSPIGVIAWKGLVLIVASTLLFGMIVRGAGLVIALPLLVIHLSLPVRCDQTPSNFAHGYLLCKHPNHA